MHSPEVGLVQLSHKKSSHSSLSSGESETHLSVLTTVTGCRLSAFIRQLIELKFIAVVSFYACSVI